MRVALVSTWGTACGIAEHAAYLKAAVEAADPDIELVPCPEMLDPDRFDGHQADRFDLVHLDYQAALHSRWTPERIKHVQLYGACPVTVTYHDTGVPNSEQCQGVVGQADRAVVHEPFDDLPHPERVAYWRMGVPAWHGAWRFERIPDAWSNGRPILGTIGFPFPWKNYDTLAAVTAASGWALLLIAPTATVEDQRRWATLNPYLTVYGEFVPRGQAGALLAGCDATAFCYTCANTGQSGAILQGIAARKPVIAFKSCRQFRALLTDPIARRAITWVDDWAGLTEKLRYQIPIARVDPAILALAEQDSWTRLGEKYAGLWKGLIK